MASERRLERLGSVIARETAQILQKGLNDPRIGPVVVTRVKLSRDLKHCRIFVNPRGSESQKKTTLKGLTSAHRVVQGKLGDILRLRYTPLIQFELDKGVEKMNEINDLFVEIQNQREKKLSN